MVRSPNPSNHLHQARLTKSQHSGPSASCYTMTVAPTSPIDTTSLTTRYMCAQTDWTFDTLYWAYQEQTGRFWLSLKQREKQSNLYLQATLPHRVSFPAVSVYIKPAPNSMFSLRLPNRCPLDIYSLYSDLLYIHLVYIHFFHIYFLAHKYKYHTPGLDNLGPERLISFWWCDRGYCDRMFRGRNFARRVPFAPISSSTFQQKDWPYQRTSRVARTESSTWDWIFWIASTKVQHGVWDWFLRQ